MTTQGPGPGALIGVEEEYLVVDATSRILVPRAGEVVTSAAKVLGERVCAEITRYQVEVKTAPHASLAGLRDDLLRLRRTAARAAAALGLTLVPSGSPVLGPPGPPPINDGPRYAQGIATFRSLHDEAHVCAVHVHVHTGDAELAVLCGNYLRPWLPVLIAALANSPFWLGRDTGYASWRALTWGKWPVAGPPPFFASLAEYAGLAAALTSSGALVDPGTIFWDIRPSAHLPTLEFRACDVPASVDDAVLLAGLVRALVQTAAARVAGGDPGPAVDPALLRAACWRAARDGFAGQCADPRTGELRDPGALLGELTSQVRDVLLGRGELAAVTSRIAALCRGGCGADRQRAVYARDGSLADVVAYLADELTAG